MNLHVTRARDIGKRNDQQDDYFSRVGLRVFAVCDGVGGHIGGAEASKLVVDALSEAFSHEFGASVGACLYNTIGVANERILVEGGRDQTKSKMGTTVAAVAFDEIREGVLAATIVHAGDSRVYRLREGLLEQLTIDHSLYQNVIDAYPNLSDLEKARLDKHTVTRVLGYGNEKGALRVVDVREGDVFLLCTDGLHGTLSHEGITSVLKGKSKSPAELLVKRVLAKKEEHQDNVTCIVIRVMA